MKRAIIKFLLIFLFGISFISCQTKVKQPNIIVFLADDMGYGDPQCYNAASKIPTPNIDKLASEGLRFTDAHSPSSVCSPTRYGILTGRYAWRSALKKGVLWCYASPLIEPERLTLPKMLKEKGYNTACIGKWHLGMHWETKDGYQLPGPHDRKYDPTKIKHGQPITGGPLTAGFDYYFGVDVPNFPPYCFIENNRLLGNPSIAKPDTVYGTAGPMLPGWKLEEILPRLTARAVEYIDKSAKGNNKKPFFLHFTSTAPHTPIVPAKEFQGKSKAGPYGDLVNQVDYSLGQLMKALERNGLTENTIVIFTSDNGSPSRAGDPFVHGPDFQKPGSVITKFGHNPNAPLRGMKADIWEGGHRVPMVIRWPNGISDNRDIATPVSSIDIMTSMASIIGYKLPDNSAEDSFDLSLLFNREKGLKEFERGAVVHHSSRGKFAIRKGDWKMIPQLGSGGWTKPQVPKVKKGEANGQLYNLKNDPTESINLWNKHPEIVKELSELLAKYKEEGRSRGVKN
jgi:arylsulfatase A-like enzyme